MYLKYRDTWYQIKIKLNTVNLYVIRIKFFLLNFLSIYAFVYYLIYNIWKKMEKEEEEEEDKSTISKLIMMMA